MLSNINNLSNVFISFLGFNSLMLIIFLSLVMQLFLFQLVIYFSYFYFLILELWVFLIILFIKPGKTDITFFVFIFYIILFTSFLISVLLLINMQDGGLILLFILILFNVLSFTVVIYIFIDSSFLILNSLVLILYIFNFKLFLLIFVLIFFSNNLSKFLLMFLLDFNYLFIALWIVFFIIMISVLLSGDLEKYLFIILNYSHYVLFMSCFLNVNVFLYCSFLDCIVCIVISQFIYLSNSTMLTGSLGPYTSLFLFLFVCHSYGVPPFPSFLLEVCFLFIFVNSLGFLFGYLLLLIFYITISLNFIFIFNTLGKIDNSIGYHNLLSDSSVLLLILLLGVFMFCFLNTFVILLV